MKQKKNNGFIGLYRIDIIVIASLLILSLSVLLIVDFTRAEGSHVEVTVDGNIVGEYPLSVNSTYSLNGGTNVLTVENGLAYMSYSNCPDHTCENTGKVKLVGQTIICLPNRIAITIVGQSDEAVDFVS